MAMRKPTPDNAHTRAIVKMLEKGPEAPVRARAKKWDGADEEAIEIMQIADGLLAADSKRVLIAARLRRIAQGPRKWGPLR